LALTLALTLALALALATTPVAASAQELRLSPASPLEFTDADGGSVRSSDFAGQWLLVYFGYTHCSDLCPTGLSVLASALEQMGPAAAHVQPLFVTVDPERDKGSILRSFATSFDPRLIGLGGTVAQIRHAADVLGVSFQKVVQGGSDYVVDHSSNYTLIDPSRSRAQVLRFAEPHLLAGKLLEELAKAGVRLDDVNNVRAYR
jgi:protein SCO1/2